MQVNHAPNLHRVLPRHLLGIAKQENPAILEQDSMLFSIITPSFRQLDWLELCAASIADQGVHLEHLVQDAGSPGIEGWITSHPQVQVTVEKDAGMYDAINRGLKRARGEICSYLNCDEQYLPGTLRKVGEYFERHPEIDIVFGDAILADESLQPVAHRRAVTPLYWHTLLRPLGVLTCSTFFRRKVVDDGVLFDPSWRSIGDKAWVLELLKRGYRMHALHEPLAVFAFTGENISNSLSEDRRWDEKLSPGFRRLRPVAQLQHVLRKWQAGAYRPFTENLSYYRREDPTHRVAFSHLRLGSFWPRQNDHTAIPASANNDKHA